MTNSPTSVTQLLGEIRDVGQDKQRGGYSRFTFTSAELELREWFVAEAQRRSMDVEVDRNGLIWAWRAGAGGSLDDAIVTGSHLDSVPGGGEFDGPLGIASALAAVDIMDFRGVVPDRPLAVVAFPEEEGGRFGLACLGSQLMTGAVNPDRARNLRDSDGNSYADAFARAGLDPAHMGRDDEALRRITAFVELHVEQGRGLIDLSQPVAIGSSILGHGRWRLTVIGEGNHAGATRMADRRDPMVAAGLIISAVRDIATAFDEARATVGRIHPIPGGTNVIASRVDVWLDARHPDDAVTAELVGAIHDRARALAEAEGCEVVMVEESLSNSVNFDPRLRTQLEAVLPDAPVLGTGAGHDAGVLSTEVPTAMLFVRNPTGVSHSPYEQIEDADAESGALALADVLENLLGSSSPVPGAARTSIHEQRRR
ncbi:allantoate amidohydrolase [Aeromicrobium sp.]|uniref:allantoate amidohydrolase n=1 Tax=Aeromicrobium sp. TaxID=1871063 RepID=UPI002FCA9D50